MTIRLSLVSTACYASAAAFILEAMPEELSEPRPDAARFPVIKEVAALAGVSPSTASRVLTQRGYASAAARQRVEEAARSLGYEPHLAAQTLKTQASRMAGVIIQDITNPFYAYVAKGIADVTRRSGLSFLLADSQEQRDREEENLRLMVQSRVAGVIVTPTSRSGNALRSVQQRGIVVIQIDRTVRGITSDIVVVDNASGAHLATNHLLALGHTRIGVIAGPRTLTTGRERLRGFQAAFEEAGILLPPCYIKLSDFRRESAVALARELLAEDPPPTAIFAHNNVIAESVLTVIRERGLRIPDDVAVVGFDDPPWTQLVSPPLTVVRQPAYEMGAMAADLLVRRLTGTSKFDSPAHVVLQPTLIVRGSCGGSSAVEAAATSPLQHPPLLGDSSAGGRGSIN